MARLLIVEDDRLSGEETANVLRDAGHDVVGLVATGEEALTLARESHPDLALVDLMLAGELDGIGVADLLHRDFGVGTIYVTGNTDPSVMRRATRVPAYSYILKPFDARTLGANVEIALARLSTDRALRSHGIWLATLLRNIGVAVIATTEDGVVRYANPLAERAMKIDTGANRRLSRCLMLVDEIQGRALDVLSRAMDSTSAIELPPGAALLRADDTQLPIEGSVSKLPDPGNEQAGLVVAFRDMSERRRIDREHQRVERLESLGTLAAGIAHDFNNMLAIVLNSASLAKHTQEPGTRVHELMSDIEHVGARASALTAQLIGFAKGGSPLCRPLWVEPLIERTVSLALRGSSVNPRYQMADGVWPTFADEGQLSQVIANLVLNARDATSPGQTVTIGARNRHIANDPSLADGRYVEIFVADSGVGISAPNLERVFDPYFSTKPRGTGLGLASAFSIVQRHSGTLRVESKPGEGSTFFALIPASEELPRVVEPPRVGAAKPIPGRILVMDDEPELRRILAMCLEELGYAVDCAADGAEAVVLVETAVRDKRPFDAVILDLTVRGGMGGLEALAELRQIQPDVRAIASSGYSDSPVLADHARFGFAGILPKPYRFTELAAVLRSLEGMPG